jgi:hypothetical protein
MDSINPLDPVRGITHPSRIEPLRNQPDAALGC